MNTGESNEEALLEQALTFTSKESREAFLQGACGGDEQLRLRVLGLIQAHEAAGGFLADPSAPTLGARTQVFISDEPTGTMIGRYKLLEKIGEGGCGVVYMAEQEEPVRRRVALKIIKLGMDTKQVIARFEAERQALALMDHPNIAKVFDAGATETGRPYFVMELVRGIKITDYCDQKKLTARERLDLFIQVCHAIQHAHQKGIIHRDIKPSNILTTLHEGVPVPVVIDFGIAKATELRLTDKTFFTAFEQFIGTPAYMSPEQADMSRLDIDTRSDIYALGVLLYELLTGKTPFEAKKLLTAGLDEMRRIIREQEPLPPSTRLNTLPEAELTTTAQHRQSAASRLIHLVRGDLDWIVMKCLEKDRARRYETANALALDIARHLKHEPIVARPPSTIYRAQKFVRRNKVIVSAAGAVALALVLGLSFSTWQAIRATRAEREQSRQRQRAEANEQRAEKALANEAAQRQMAQQQFYCASIGQVQALIDQGQYGRAQQILAQTNLASRRGWEWGWLGRKCNLDLMTLFGGGPSFTGVAFSPDGRWVVASSWDSTVRIWDAVSGAERPPWRGHTNTVVLLGFSPDSRRLVTASFDGTAKVWETGTGRVLFTLTGHSNALWCAAFSPDGKIVATGGSDHTVRLWDASQGTFIRTAAVYGDTVMCLAFSPNSQKLAYAGGSGNTWNRSRDNTVRIINLAKGESHVLTGHTNCVSGLAFHPDGHRVLTASWDGTARLGDVRTDTELRPFFQITGLGGLLTAAFSPDGQVCAIAGGAMGPQKAEAGVHLIEVKTQKLLQVFEGHARPVRSVAFSADGARLASTSLDGTLKVWPVTMPPEYLSCEGHDQAIWAVAVSSNSQLVATGSLDQTARIWDLESGRLLRLVPVGFPVVSLAFTPEGDRLLTVASHGAAKLWDLRLGEHLTDSPPPTPEIVRTFTGHSDSVLCVASSRPGRYFATGSKDLTTRIWEAQSGRLIHTLKGHTNWVISVAFSPDATRIATASADRTVRVWDVATAQLVFLLAGHTDQVLQVAWSPDGHCLASGGQDGVIRLWGAQTGAPRLAPLEGHRDGVSALVFSPDGDRLATAAGGLNIAKAHNLDNSVFLWDVATGQSILRLRPHFNAVRALAFSAEGTRLVTGSVDNTAHIYHAFSWRLADYPGNPGASPADRFEGYKREYWSTILATASDQISPRPGRRIETRIFEFNVAAEKVIKDRPAHPVPNRGVAAGSNQVNLDAVFNAALDESWLPVSSLDDLDHDLSALPAGLQTLGGVLFEMRGLVQLRRQAPDWSKFPEQVRVSIGRHFRQFHVLQGGIHGELDGTVIGVYRLCYADGQTVDQEIRYAEDLLDWRERHDLKSRNERAAVAWTGPRWANSPANGILRLFKTTYNNPHPEKEVVHIDFISQMTETAPLLVALTVD